MTDAEYCPVCGRRHLEHRPDCPMGAAQERIKQLKDDVALERGDNALLSETIGEQAAERERLEAEVARLRAIADAAAWLYRALGYHQTTVHPEPAPAPVLPMRDLYDALLAAGYTTDGEHVERTPENDPDYHRALQVTDDEARAALAQDAPREGE